MKSMSALVTSRFAINAHHARRSSRIKNTRIVRERLHRRLARPQPP